MQISQQEWKDHLDTVQFSGKQERKKLHDNYHTSEHCQNMPALGKNVTGFGARLWFPAYANSANKKLSEGKGSEAKWPVQEAADALAAGYADKAHQT